MRRITGILTVFLWAVSAWQLALIGTRMFRGTAGDTPVIGKVLRPEAAEERVLPLILLVTFGFVLLDVLLQYLKVVKEKEDAVAFASVPDSTAVAGLKLSTLGIAGRRADVIRHYMSTQPAALHDALPGASGLDAAEIETRFAQTRALIWALPVLGFIGTAFGLSKAISGFSTALNLPDPAVVVQSLGQTVIPGLSGAFAITMLALAASTVGHLCVTALTSSYHDVLKRIDDSCVLLLARIPRESGRGGGQAGVADSELKSLLYRIAELLRNQDMTEAGQELRNVASELSSSAEALAGAADSITKSNEQPYYVTVRRGPDADPVSLHRR